MSSLPPNDGQQPQPAARPAAVQNQPGQRGQQAAASPARNRQVDTGTNPPVDPLTNHPLRYTAGKQAETKQRGKDKPVNEQTPQAEEENKRLADEEKRRQEDLDNGNDTGVVG